MYKLIFEKFLKEFIKAVGRKPQTRKELMSIQDDVVRYLNKTKGVPGKKSTSPSSPFQGFKPTVIQGGKSKEGITSIPVNKQIQDLKTFEREVIDELNAPIQPDLKVVPKFSKNDRILQIDDELDKLVLKEGKYAKMSRNEREDLIIKLQDESSTLQDKTLFKDSPEAIAKIKADNKAAAERLRNKKKTVEDFRDDGDFDPGGMASGGLARVGMFGGGPIRLAKGASWVINKLKEQLFDLDLGIGGSRFSKLGSTQKEGFKNELKTLIKQLEQGGEIPNEMLDTMIADPKFKGMVKTRSTDKDLFELEDALLDRQAAKQADQMEGEAWDRGRDVVDSLTGPKEIKRRKQIETLKKFDVKGRTKQASGGIAGQLHMNEGGRASFTKGGKVSSGLANILGV